MDPLILQGAVTMLLGFVLIYATLWATSKLNELELGQIRKQSPCNFNGQRHEWGWTREQSYMCINCGKSPDEDVASASDFEIEE